MKMPGVPRFAVISAGVALLLGLAYAQSRADDADSHDSGDRGAYLAHIICAECHIVGRNQSAAPDLKVPATSFVDIANRPETNVQSLRRFILTTHWDGHSIPPTMPNPMLSGEEATAVARYIVSLRKPTG